MIWILPLFGLLAFEAIADIFSEKYAMRGGAFLWIAAIVGYIIANIFWLSSMKNGSGLARGSMLFAVGSAVVAVMLGVFLFHEKLDNHELAGIVFGIVSVSLILWR